MTGAPPFGKLPTPPLSVVTDRVQCSLPIKDVIRASYQGGARWIGIRERDLSDGGQAELVRFTQQIHPSMRVILWGSVALAKRCRAHGVHLNRDGHVARTRAILGAKAIIGISCHDEAEIAAAKGADYITVSPVFETASKPGYASLGLERFKQLADSTTCPVIALGGIGPGNAASALTAGAAGIAVMGEVMRADDPETTVRGILDALKSTAL